MLNHKYSLFRWKNREPEKNKTTTAAHWQRAKDQLEFRFSVLACEIINIQLFDSNECFWPHTHRETHTQEVKETDGGKACSCLFSHIFYSKAGCLLFNCIFCIELIASRLEVAAWDDRQVTRGKEITTLPMKCTFVQVSEGLFALSKDYTQLCEVL